MSFVPGEKLNLVWPNMAAEEKKGICRQLREILERMRSIPWETGLIGSCLSGAARGCRQYSEYSDGPYKDEATFNSAFYFDLLRGTPEPIHAALFQQLRHDHRIVFSHGDIAQHNILVENGRITGLIDWKNYAEEIFPQSYYHEQAYHQAILRWQRPQG